MSLDRKDFSQEREIECTGCSAENTSSVRVSRFIRRLDAYFATNDLAGAGQHLSFWEGEMRADGDTAGLITVLNEEVGYFRRTGDRENALRVTRDVLSMLDAFGADRHPAGATVLINAATTLKFCERPAEGLPLYDRAQAVYRENGKEDTFEYAALLNNKAAALCDLARYDEAEACNLRAIDSLQKIGGHDGEIAVTLVNYAHLLYDRNENDVPRVEKTLDAAWELLNSPRQPHDANYAFILSKCAPSLRYFGRTVEADALEAVAAEIYAAGAIS